MQNRSVRDSRESESFTTAFLIGQYGKAIEQLTVVQEDHQVETAKAIRFWKRVSIAALLLAASSLFLPDEILIDLVKRFLLSYLGLG